MVQLFAQPYLDQLKDVTITSPADNNLLAYDSSSGMWINQTPAEAGLDDLYVNVTGDTMTGELLIKEAGGTSLRLQNTSTNIMSGDVISEILLEGNQGNLVGVRMRAIADDDWSGSGSRQPTRLVIGTQDEGSGDTTITNTITLDMDGNLSVDSGNFDVASGNITLSGNITTVGTGYLGNLFVDNIHINNAIISSDTGAISFLDENLTTTGTLASGTHTIGTLILATGSITDTTGAISFGNENLTTTGTIEAAIFTAGGTDIDDIYVNQSGDTMTGDLNFGDNVGLIFGTGSDATLNFNASDLKLILGVDAFVTEKNLFDAANPAGNYAQFIGNRNTGGGNTFGIWSAAQYDGGGTAGAVTGLNSFSYITDGGASSATGGSYAVRHYGGGTVASARGLKAHGPTVTNGGTVTDGYAIIIFDGSVSGSTMTNQTGLYIPVLDAATNNFGIVLDGDGEGSDVYFGASQNSKIDYSTNMNVYPALVGTGHFQIEGTYGSAIETITTNTTLDQTHSTVIVDASSGSVTITLPAVSGLTGRIYSIKSEDSSNTITVDGNASETIDGSTTMNLATDEVITIQTDGVEWFII